MRPSTGTLPRRAAVLAAGALLAGIVTLPGSRVIFAQSTKEPPSKIAHALLERIGSIQSARALGRLTPQAAGSLSDPLVQVSAGGEITVEFHAASQVSDVEAGALAALGATIVDSTANVRWPPGVAAPPDLGIITVTIPADQIAAAAALPWVVAVRPAEKNPPDVGTFLSEGVALHNSADANAAGFTGAGVSVGAISDGVSNLAAAQAIGELPAVNVINAGGGDEGTAMLEIVHDLAPGAALLFHGTGGGVGGHITALNNLAAAGAQVITEDIPFDAEPAFQKGAAAVAAENLAVAGISVHSSAGNLGTTHAARVTATGTGGGPDGNAGPFAGCGAGGPTNTVAIAPAADTTFDVTVGAGGTVRATLQWSEPRAIFPTPGLGGFTDLDLFIMDAALTTCLAQSIATQSNGTGDTIEQASWTNGGAAAANVKLVVNVFGTSSAVAAPLLDLRWRGAGAVDAATRAGSLNPDSNYTFGATSAAAANASGSTNPATVNIEGFSGGGPVQLVSTTVCTPGDPPPCVGTAGGGGQTVGAPTWTAADGVSVSGAGGFGSGTCPAVTQGDCRFFGTSAAAPHAAGVAALVREALGGSPTIFEIHQRMADTARDRGVAGFDNVWGFGVLNARAATGEEADLRVLKDCKPDAPIDAGQLATCTIFVDNLGPSLARNVQLTDTHFSVGTFSFGGVTTSQGTCSPPAGGVVSCALGDLPAAAPGTSGRATITVRLSAANATDINDVATAVSDTPDPDNSNNEAQDTVVVRSVADLRITKADGPDPVNAGDTLTYTLTITNDGPSNAVNVVAEDFAPSGVVIESVTASGASSCNAGVPGDPARPSACTFDALASGASRTMTLVVTVLPDTTGSLKNDAAVRSDVFDPDNSDNLATAATTIAGSADLVVQKADTPDPVLAGRLLTYTLRVFNDGPSTAAGVTVEDMLPNEVDFVSATIAGASGTCVVVDVPPAPPAKKVVCQLGSMAPNAGSPAFVYVDARVKSGTADAAVIVNTATVASSTADPDGADNTAMASTTVLNRADLAIVKTSDADIYKPSSTVVYTITVTQNGPSDAEDVVVTDALPAIKAAVYLFDTAGCSHAGSLLTCNLGTMTAGSTRSFNVHVRIRGSAGEVTNTASVESDTFDPNPSNNSSTRVVLVKGGT